MLSYITIYCKVKVVCKLCFKGTTTIDMLAIEKYKELFDEVLDFLNNFRTLLHKDLVIVYTTMQLSCLTDCFILPRFINLILDIVDGHVNIVMGFKIKRYNLILDYI